ncbi:MAG: PH domain-containing protein [Lentisphaeria bacterium]|nr:PH domain-containing protein [Lentisphaeria bacterium]
MEDRELRPCPALCVLWVLCAGFAAAVVAGTVAGVVGAWRGTGYHAFAVAFVIAWLALSLLVVLYFQSLRYALDARYVSKASGVLWRRRRSIPLEKITNIDVVQGPIERLAGMGQVWIYTPSTGADTPEEKLVGVAKPQEVKADLVRRIAEAEDALARAAFPDSQRVTDLLTEIRDALQRLEKSLETGRTPAAADPE